MRGFLLPLASGDAGIRQTVSAMRTLARRASLHPTVRQVAAELVTGEPRETHPLLIRDFVSDHTEFLPDPTYGEALHDPVWSLLQILTRGLVGLDCDDVAMLAAALGLSVGLPVRYVVLAFGSPSAPFQHVIAELRSERGGWLGVDPTLSAQSFPPVVGRSMIVEV